MTFRNTIDFLASCIFTKRCRFCNRVCDVRDEICSRCADDIHRIEGEICNNCGCNKTLFNHKERKHFFESICAPYYYEGAPQKAVIHLKHKINPNILTRLAEDMSECVKERYKEHLHTTALPRFSVKYRSATHNGQTVYLYILPLSQENEISFHHGQFIAAEEIVAQPKRCSANLEKESELLAMAAELWKEFPPL